MPARFLSGNHMLEHMYLGGVGEVDGPSARLHLLDSEIGDLDLTEGVLFVNRGTCGSLVVDSASIIGQGLTAGAVTINAVANQTIRLTNLTCAGLTITGGAGNQDIVINGLTMPTGRLIVTGTFGELSIRNAVIGQKLTSTTFTSGGTIDYTDVTSFDLQATVYRAWRNGARFEDCVAGRADLVLIDPGVQADNTHDAVNLVGICDRLALYGAVYGAVNQANNPRYALAAAAGTLAPVDVYMSMAGYQTGAVNDLSGGSVVLH